MLARSSHPFDAGGLGSDPQKSCRWRLAVLPSDVVFGQDEGGGESGDGPATRGKLTHQPAPARRTTLALGQTGDDNPTL